MDSSAHPCLAEGGPDFASEISNQNQLHLESFIKIGEEFTLPMGKSACRPEGKSMIHMNLSSSEFLAWNATLSCPV